MPLLVLAGDFIRAPYIFQTQISDVELSVQGGIDNNTKYLGRLNSHQIYVSSDEIAQPDFLAEFKSMQNAIVITHFLTIDGRATRSGLLGRAVRSRLSQSYPEAERRFIQLQEGSSGYKPGHVFPLQIEDHNDAFPVTAIYIVMLTENAKENPRATALMTGLREVYALASAAEINNLIVPALGIDEQASHLPFPQFLDAALDVLPSSRYPENLYLSWYPRWATKTLTAANRALSAKHITSFSAQSNLAARLESPILRLACIALALCLLSTSLALTLNWLKFIIICTSFLGVFAGLWGLMGFLASDLNRDITFWLRVVSIMIGAIVFRWTVHWDVKALFTAAREK